VNGSHNPLVFPFLHLRQWRLNVVSIRMCCLRSVHHITFHIRRYPNPNQGYTFRYRPPSLLNRLRTYSSGRLPRRSNGSFHSCGPTMTSNSPWDLQLQHGAWAPNLRIDFEADIIQASEAYLPHGQLICPWTLLGRGFQPSSMCWSVSLDPHWSNYCSALGWRYFPGPICQINELFLPSAETCCPGR
jgi:hypothetical protein